MFLDPRVNGSLRRKFGYEIRILDGPNFYVQLKDEFVRQIYWFPSDAPDPHIIDAGSNIGMSVLYFKRLYPASRVLAFEPDPVAFAVLSENVERNALQGVTLVQAALGREEGTTRFTRAGGNAGGSTTAYGELEVSIRRLSGFIDAPVDLVKMNVEGAELSVVEDLVASASIGHVKRLVIEYHAWPDQPSRLAPLLSLLDEAGFSYIIHDFSEETNPVTKPPIRFSGEPYFLLIYARRGLD